MEEIIMNVAWVPVVVGAIVAFFVGWLWYSPKLFGTKWAEGVGITINDNHGPMMMALIAQVAGTFLFAWVIGLTASQDALLTAILITITIATIVKANGLFAQKSMYAIRVEVGYILVMAIIMIVTHAIL